MANDRQTCYNNIVGEKIMRKTSKQAAGKRPNAARALALHRKLLQEGLGDRFSGMTEEEIIRAIKKTREEIWSEKLAARP